MLIPQAYHVIWFSATFLLLWSLSVIVRGMPGTRVSRFFRTKSVPQERAHVSWRAIAVGTAVCVVSIWLFMTGEGVRAWTLGESELEDVSSFGVFHAAGAGIFAFAFTIGCMGLFRDSARGRKRCAKCWYDMAGVAASGRFVCPECGTDAKDATGLGRTRRHRGPVIAAVVLIAVAALMPRFQHVSTGGIKAALPTTVLIAGVWVWPDTWIDSPNWDDESSLWHRLDEESAWGWQRRWAADRARSKLSHVRTLAEFKRAASVLSGATDGEGELPPETLAHVARRLASADAEVRWEALEICQQCGVSLALGEGARAIIDAGDEIAGALHQPEADVVMMAAEILSSAQTQRDKTLAMLLENYGERTDPTVRWRTTLMLNVGRVEKSVIEAIDARLRSPDPAARRLTVEGIFSWKTDPASIEPLLKRLEEMGESDPDPGVAESAAARCIFIRSRQPNPVPFLLEKASSTGHFRIPALRRLGVGNRNVALTPDVFEVLRAELGSADPQVVIAVLNAVDSRALAEDKSMKTFMEAVTALTAHADADVREAAESAKRSIEALDEEKEAGE